MAGYDTMFGFDTTQKQTLENLLAGSTADLAVQVANLNAWAAALATKLNADFTAQNALADFPLTLDVNYDTNPQA